MAIRASRKPRAALARIAKKHPLLQLLAASRLLADLFHLLAHEPLHGSLAAQTFLARPELGVLHRQTPQKIARELRIAVRHRHPRIMHIELQRMALPAILLE